MSSFLAGCSGSVNLRTEAEVPQPLVSEIPLRLGVHFDKEFRNYIYEEDTEDRPEWRIDNSDSRLAMFEQVLSSMFREVRPVESIDAAAGAGVDAVISPEVEEMQLALPRETYSELYEAWIKYNIRLFSPDGKLITEWPVTGYGKSVKGFMTSSDNGLNTAIAMALRDIGAKLALGFPQAAPVRQWLAARSGGCSDSAALTC
jgi:hypothetical protein